MACSYFKSQVHRSARNFSLVVEIDDIPELTYRIRAAQLLNTDVIRVDLAHRLLV